jgi:hypothetical protein
MVPSWNRCCWTWDNGFFFELPPIIESKNDGFVTSFCPAEETPDNLRMDRKDCHALPRLFDGHLKQQAGSASPRSAPAVFPVWWMIHLLSKSM